MSNDYWDNSNIQPNLARLPAYVREGMTAQIPMRPNECNTAFMIFRQSPGLNHPNARCNVTAFRKSPENSSVCVELGVQIDFAEFSGRIPLATAILDKKFVGPVLSGLLRAYKEIGGDIQEIIKQALAVQETEEGVQYFEDRNIE